MKEALHFEIEIQAPVAKVWDTMLELETYKVWTQAFEPTSYYVGSWEKESKMLFLSASGRGMAARIAENIPHQFISVQHIGEVNPEAEDPYDVAQEWSGAFENYTFTDKGNVTHLAIDMEMESTPETIAMKQMFEVMWPAALLKLKELCEK